MNNYISFTKILTATVLVSIAGATNSYAKTIDGNSIDLQSSKKQTSSFPSKILDTTQTADPQNSHAHNPYEIFAPKEHTLNTTFGYTFWDDALRGRVISLGPSLRRFARPLKPRIGTRLVKRSQSSKYRLEGSRLKFHYFSDKYIAVLGDYKDDLVQLAHKHDIQSFSRNEQLAYWINLHNVILIEAIAKNHPTQKPSKLVFGVDEAPLHEAKHITVKGVPLSLKNIREDIVYKNWDNPDVIYGFYRGDIGSPRLESYAMTAENVDDTLKVIGFEYVTSLRGFHRDSFSRKVSKIYEEARPYYFSNWPVDMESHLTGYLKNHEILAEVQEDKPINFIKYDTFIADLWGGQRRISPSSTIGTKGIDRPPVFFELAVKLKELERKGLLKKKGTVIIEDIETEDK